MAVNSITSRCTVTRLQSDVTVLRVIACIETPEVINKIFTHLAARNTGCIDHPGPFHATV